ncbi:ATP-binding protein [Streptomyces sp. NPDC052051]|uniref:ATP-binding protein n=1 Tax=Streptomyces sp. NPDC052051 TaxID=3154649 RepID=UPI00342D516F
MSLPLTRRIARAALLIAAGAAPVVGAAGSACAATTDLPGTQNLGGLTSLQGAQVGSVDGAARKVTGIAGNVGHTAVKKATPVAQKTAGRLVGTATPVAQKATGAAAGQNGGLLGDSAKKATGGGLPTQGLPLPGLPLGG